MYVCNQDTCPKLSPWDTSKVITKINWVRYSWIVSLCCTSLYFYLGNRPRINNFLHYCVCGPRSTLVPVFSSQLYLCRVMNTMSFTQTVAIQKMLLFILFRREHSTASHPQWESNWLSILIIHGNKLIHLAFIHTQIISPLGWTSIPLSTMHSNNFHNLKTKWRK